MPRCHSRHDNAVHRFADHVQHRIGDGPKRSLKNCGVVLAVLALLLPGVLFAGDRSASMRVSVNVVARAVITIEEQPQTFIVTAEDVRRGYVDLSSPLRLHVRTNARDGYILRIVNVDPAFSSVALSGGDIVLNAQPESTIVRPRTPGGDTLVLAVRLTLGRDARAGEYAFPVTLDASPLT